MSGNVFQDPEWWKKNVRVLDWVRFRSTAGVTDIRLVLQKDPTGIVVESSITPTLLIPYNFIDIVYEIRHDDGPKWFPMKVDA